MIIRRVVFILVLAISFASCNNQKQPSPFTANMLTRQLFTIDNSRDTTLQTLHGAKVRIKAGSFKDNGKIKIEIREALTAAEILAAGLITESDGRLLASGGMIYINATSKGKKNGLAGTDQHFHT